MCCAPYLDKTGTITSDDLVVHGVVPPEAVIAGVVDEVDIITPSNESPREAALVMAGCHSVARVDGADCWMVHDVRPTSS